MRRKKLLFLAIIVVFVAITTYMAYGLTNQLPKPNNPALIYEIDDSIQYKITTNKMMDTYLIACALSMDFKSPIIMPDTENHALYKKAKAYFSPYANHPFLNDFDKYTYNGDMNGDVIGVLLSYSQTPALEKLHQVAPNYRQYMFKENEAIDDFINGLRAFYGDTDAETFFNENMDIMNTMKNYITNRIGDTMLHDLILATEAYVGTKDKYYGDKPISYETVLTLFRPSMASFYTLETNDAYKLATFQSPNDYNRDPYIFDTDYMVENVIHEFLHSYINRPIADLTLKICGDTSKFVTKVTDNPMYEKMPLHRQIDEYLVRAIEGRIYRSVTDEKTALNRILNKEIQFGGFPRLMEPYHLLEEYESGRDVYPDIDSFLCVLIEALAKK